MPIPITVDAVVLVSWYKPILFVCTVGGWARLAGMVDQDLTKQHLPRSMWNGIHMGAAVAAFGLWLLIPIFWLGFPLAVFILAGTLAFYAVYRNAKVPPADRWMISPSFFQRKFADKIDDIQEARAQKQLLVNILDSEGKPAPLAEPETILAQAQEALQEILVHALERSAQRVDFLAEAQQTSVSVFIDGLRYPQPNIAAKTGVVMIDFIKSNAGLDVNDRRKKQVGQLRLKDANTGPRTAPVITSGASRGLNLSLVLDRGFTEVQHLEKLGLLEIQKQQLIKGLDQPNPLTRVVIVSAPPQNGQTATMYSLLSRHDPYTLSVATLEEEVPYEVEGINHGRVDLGTDAATFNQRLKAIILRDPQVVLVGKIVDPQTLKLVTDASANARIYCGLRQEDTFMALKAWTKAVGDPQMAANSVAVVVAQRLLRRLCPTCRVAYKPDPEVLRKSNLAADKVTQLYKHTGQVRNKDRIEPCPDCMGLGFLGRVAVFEVMVLDDEARNFVAAGEYEQLRGYLRKQRMLWLREAAWARVVEGVTAVSELVRVFERDDPSGASGSAMGQPQSSSGSSRRAPMREQ